ncbi:MAG: 4-hydroxy-2-oxovalerate aldolase [Candidatus Omnitrophica bacterium]|nr:4-hydroxy-2-oxovalerate aldolase [Candidatus Omnitrophota bacterium]
MSQVLFFDSTLRDGSHAVGHQLSLANIKNYCSQIDSVGLHTVIVGHGNGLGASSLQVGIAAVTDMEMLKAARKELKRTKLGVFLIPGFGTIKDDIQPAIDYGADLFCVANHCTEADVTKQHIEFLTKKNKEAYGVLMMYHMAPKERLLQEALKMQSYGAKGVILMDSAGASTPDMVSETVSYLAANIEIKLGFHAHNNLGLAISNSLVALQQGALIIDGTLRGFGAGAGNCQLEVLVGLLLKMGIASELELYRLMDVSENVVAKIMKKPQEITSLSLISGMAGVFSGFAEHVRKAAERFKVDPRDIFMELGRRKMVAGQEDFIVDVAMYLASRKGSEKESYDIESLL